MGVPRVEPGGFKLWVTLDYLCTGYTVGKQSYVPPTLSVLTYFLGSTSALLPPNTWNDCVATSTSTWTRGLHRVHIYLF
jgi:hypothetical protein